MSTSIRRNRRTSYEAIIFDNDGVLTTPNDEELLREATHRAFEEAGVLAPKPAHVEGLLRNVGVPWFEDVCGTYGLDTEEFWRLRDESAATLQRKAIREGRKTPFDDVAAVTALDHDLAIVSTNQHETIEFILEYFDLESQFRTYYGREPTVGSLRRKKPAPYYLDRAMDDLGTRDAIYVGDSESDIRAAANAGIDSAFVRRPHARTTTSRSSRPTRSRP